MEFSTTKEERVVPAQSFNTPARTYTVIKLKGPCLVCEREMDYIEKWPYSEEHARKQFAPGLRLQVCSSLAIQEPARGRGVGGTKPRTAH